MKAMYAVLFLLTPLLVAPAVNAGRPVQASGSFTGTSTVLSVETFGRLTIIQATDNFQLTGDFSGTCLGEERTIIDSEGRVKTMGSCIFTGAILGRSGTALFRAMATGVAGVSFEGGFVGLGIDGDLSNLRTIGTVQGAPTGETTLAGTYSAQVHFDPA